MTWTLVQHAHTRHSFDSLAAPADLVRVALAGGVHVLAVTDHDTWQGSLDVREAARGSALRVVLGVERFTDHGDLIGLLLKADVVEKSALRFCDAVHAQGGLVVLPHPYKWHRLEDAMIEKVDLIETHNARCAAPENELAEALAERWRKPVLAGSDAHRAGELLLARNEFEGELPADDAGLKRALLEAPRTFRLERASIWNEWRSQGVKFLRRPSLGAGYQLLRGAARRVLRPEAFPR